MFSPADFDHPKRQSSPFLDNRRVGTILLAVSIVLLILMAMNYDQEVFIPFNATLAVTQTWQAEHPATRTPRPQREPTSVPRRTPRRDDGNQSASFIVE